MTRTPAELLADGEMIEKVAEECHHASCANVPRFNPDYSRDSYPWEHCPTSVKDAWRAIARAAIAAYNPNDRLREALEEAVAYIRWLADGDSDTIVHAGTLRAKADKLDAALSHKD